MQAAVLVLARTAALHLRQWRFSSASVEVLALVERLHELECTVGHYLGDDVVALLRARERRVEIDFDLCRSGRARARFSTWFHRSRCLLTA